MIYLSLLHKYKRLCRILKTSFIQIRQKGFSKTVTNESRTKEILDKIIYICFHLENSSHPHKKALWNVYNMLISNEILGIKSFKQKKFLQISNEYSFLHFMLMMYVFFMFLQLSLQNQHLIGEPFVLNWTSFFLLIEDCCRNQLLFLEQAVIQYVIRSITKLFKMGSFNWENLS